VGVSGREEASVPTLGLRVHNAREELLTGCICVNKMSNFAGAKAVLSDNTDKASCRRYHRDTRSRIGLPDASFFDSVQQCNLRGLLSVNARRDVNPKFRQAPITP
jgi:hypothetical protein